MLSTAVTRFTIVGVKGLNVSKTVIARKPGSPKCVLGLSAEGQRPGQSCVQLAVARPRRGKVNEVTKWHATEMSGQSNV